MNPVETAIHLAFRFHVNFYHSYRGDTPDENGIGKDIRIIGHILEALGRLNADGIPVRGTWDIENYFSLEKLMPAHCPELTEGIRRRVSAGVDEVEPMGYNNGFLSAHTEEELAYALRYAIENPYGSGLKDVFGAYEPVLRPQECMYTPSFLRLCPENGIPAISIFYSAHPFNGFSNFIPRLPFAQRYNPLWLTADGAPGKMTLLPCYNHGDIADHITLRGWLKAMRRAQLREKEPRDLILVIDMDADDPFWTGYDFPIVKDLIPTAAGLERIVRSVSDLSYLRFTCPGEYLKDHAPIASVKLGQDTADGSFDGYSSWVEKWQNKTLWTALERARFLSAAAKDLGAKETQSGREALEASLRARVLTLSTTHFGLASPVMNAGRQGDGMALAKAAGDAALSGVFAALKEPEGEGLELYFANPTEKEGAAKTAGLVRLRPSLRLSLRPDWDAPAFFEGEAGEMHAAFSRTVFGEEELCVSLARNTAHHKTVLTAPRAEKAFAAENPVRLEKNGIVGHGVAIELAQNGGARILDGGQSLLLEGFPRCGVRYGGKLITLRASAAEPRLLGGGAAGLVEVQGEAALEGGKPLSWSCQYLLLHGLPYVYADVELRLPKTEFFGYDAGRAERLGTAYDTRWQEVMPFELALGFAAERAPYTLWKRNYFGDVSRFALDYGSFSKNKTLDSMNNQITGNWVAVTNGERGLLLAQSAASYVSAAFCPMRLAQEKGGGRLLLNPFGTYHGKQWHYQTRSTGLGKAMALSMADHLDSYAPSYNGETVRFSLMLAPFAGDTPPAALCADAQRYAYPPLARGAFVKKS